MSRIGSVYQLDGIPSRPTQNMKQERWLELRREGIGGSDIGAIMGLNPYRSAFEVFCDKKGLIKPEDLNEAMEFGIRMEPVLRHWAEELLQADSPNRKVFASPYLYQATDDRRAIANIDGVVLDERNGETGLEIKTASEYMTKAWEGDEIPDHYYAQDQWYMRVTGLAGWWMAPLVGKRFFLRHVPRNEAFIERQKGYAAAFNKQLDDNIMPAPAGLPGDLDVLLQLFPNASEEILEDEGREGLLAEYRILQAKVKEIEASKDKLKAEIELAIGERKVLLAGVLKASWSRYDVARIDGDKLKTEYPDIYEACKKTTRQGRLTVSAYVPKKGKEIAA